MSKLTNQFCALEETHKNPHIYQLNNLEFNNTLEFQLTMIFPTNIFKLHLDGKHGVRSNDGLKVKKQDSFLQRHHILVGELKHTRQDMENVTVKWA